MGRHASPPGLSPNTTYTVTCHGNPQTVLRDVDHHQRQRRLDDRSCYYGYPGNDFWVTVDSYESNTINW